jgi:hypothetical protein
MVVDGKFDIKVQNDGDRRGQGYAAQTQNYNSRGYNMLGLGAEAG